MTRSKCSARPGRRKSAGTFASRIEAFAPGGGYVFNQVQNIQANVPPENIIAMMDAAYDFGGCGNPGDEAPLEESGRKQSAIGTR